MDDRKLDTVNEALKATVGISFLAAEGGEEDIKLRGFSLAAIGDIFVDGMRDPAPANAPKPGPGESAWGTVRLPATASPSNFSNALSSTVARS